MRWASNTSLAPPASALSAVATDGGACRLSKLSDSHRRSCLQSFPHAHGHRHCLATRVSVLTRVQRRKRDAVFSDRKARPSDIVVIIAAVLVDQAIVVFGEILSE